MTCPSCNGKIQENDVVGAYCIKCGLILSSYNPSIKFKKSFSRYGTCIGCGTKDNLTIHHIIPLREGGKKDIVLLCRTPCHNIADKIANVLYPKQIKILEEK